MVAITALWLPIVLAAVFVFLASSILHMATPWHNGDYAKLPDEDGVRAAMRKSTIPPGEYSVPHCTSMKDLNDEMKAKYEEGPVGFLTIVPNGQMKMGKFLIQWFLFTIYIGIFVAYLTGRLVPAGAEYMNVFRVAGTVAFLGYVGAAPSQSIWKGQKWSTTVKFLIDGLIYALLTAGAFGWLWPGA
ncbi:MAG: hypothetical protein OER88_12840 [Planctomycetota bacterium]|nr:hypothetical protein [Planctomycetota bacterium]